jgi:hypothetical protein
MSPALVLDLQTIMDQTLGIRADEIFHGLNPVPILQAISNVQDRKDRHHALEGPDADILTLRDEKLGILQIEIIPNLDRKVAVPIDSLHTHFYFRHDDSSVCLP